MLKYKSLYFKMLNASEDAIREIDKSNFGKAKEILIAAQLKAEEIVMNNGEVAANEN